MNKANYSDIKYDPELPFALVYSDEDETTVTSRFIERGDAESWLKYNNYVNTRVVDTTPKPKIPEGAEFIHYSKSGYDFYARQLENGDWKTDGGVLYSYSEILEVVEATEVTVLVRKEET